MEIIFLLLAFCNLWVFGGYGLFIKYLSGRFPERRYVPAPEPSVSVIVPAYNEEKVIAKRLENLLGQEYPSSRLQLLVVDSGSSDSTRNIVRSFREKGVVLIEQAERRGKGAAIKEALKDCTGEIVVVTDANSYFEADTLKELTAVFSDKAVGGATGRFTVRKAEGSPGSQVFREYENGLREYEDRIDSCVSLFGEIFACRRELLTVDESCVAEDFDSSLYIREKGARLAYAGRAQVYEYAPQNVADLFMQRKRVLIGTIQTLVKHRAMFFNPAYGWFGTLILPGHKLFPVLAPFFLAGFLLVFLLLYPFLFLLGAGVVLSGVLLSRDVFRLVRYVAIVNLACFAAWRDFFRGAYSVKWQKMESTRV